VRHNAYFFNNLMRLKKMNFKNIIIVVLCFLSHVLMSQTIKGTVKTQSGIAIPSASISVLNSSKGTVADKDGNFTLDLGAGIAQISISAVGFATKIAQIDANDKAASLDIVLDDNTATLGEVLVSANKKEEDILKVSTSITSLSAQKIEDMRTVSLANLTALVPNYLYQELGVGFQALQSIRGIQVFSENPAVATYIDDVNNLDILANGMMLTDIERIEILRGPQGTLFGRNAMGGVVNIITKKPTNRTEGFAELGIGNLALQRHAVGFKMPIIKDKLFFGINGLYQSRAGYWKNDTVGTGSKDVALQGRTVGGEKNLYGNAYLKWLPSANFSATLNVKAQQDKSEETGFFVSQSSETSAFKNPNKINLSRIGEHERNIINSALTLKYFGEGFTLTSISALQRIGLSFKDIDFPGYYHSFYKKEIGESLPPQNVFSQEARINGTTADSKLQYTAGLFYFSQVGYEPSTNLAYELAPNTYSIFRNKSDNSGVAAFGELTYKITDKLSATGGLRYDSENRKSIFNGFGDASFSGGKFTQTVLDTTVSGKYTALSPKIALSFAPTDKSNLYISFTRGFRAGGVNAQKLPKGIRQTFDPEYSNNYELGYKMQTVNNRLSFGVSAFLIQWQDLQFFNLVAPFTYARENVGDAQSSGVELEASAIPVTGFQVDASVGFNQTEYKDFSLKRVSFVTAKESITPIGSKKLSNAPSHTLFLGAQYTAKLTDKFNLILRGEVRNMGEFYTDIQNTLQQPAYTLINANISLNYGNYGLSLWGQNLANQAYLAYGNADTSFGRSVRTAAPRTLGVTLKAKF
jgi:iron complex outermembrane recepter protein